MARHPSQGPGWGGPAKGGGTSTLQPFAPGNDAARHVRMDRAARKELRALRAEMLEDKLFHLAHNAEREETQVTAAVRLHAILEGMPVARVLNASVDNIGDLSDDAIRDELARLGGTSAGAAAGDEAQGVSGEPAGVVH